jgi:hypothetical protein
LSASIRTEGPLTFLEVPGPHGHRAQSVQRGKTARGPQRYWGQQLLGTPERFLLDDRKRGYGPAGKRTLLDLSLNASGGRETAQGLRRSPDTVRSQLTKQAPVLASVNTALLHPRPGDEPPGGLACAGAAAMDAMGSGIGKHKVQRWRWHALDYLSNLKISGRRRHNGRRAISSYTALYISLLILIYNILIFYAPNHLRLSYKYNAQLTFIQS